MIKQYRWFPDNSNYSYLSNVDFEALKNGTAFTELLGTALLQVAIQAPPGTEIILTSEYLENINFSTLTSKALINSSGLLSLDFRMLEQNFRLGAFALNLNETLFYPTGVIIDIVTKPLAGVEEEEI